MPMVAIGGINETNYRSCLNSGADGISLISAIAWAEDVRSAASAFSMTDYIQALLIYIYWVML